MQTVVEGVRLDKRHAFVPPAIFTVSDMLGPPSCKLQHGPDAP